ncbi:MAG TPA: hypothetical protein V6C63_12600 [Allocoleopsis sp.]
MSQVGWFLVAWVGGSLAILGSLMTLGSLLLWGVPSSGSGRSLWQDRLKLMVVSMGLAIAGFSLLVVFPLPRH